MHNLVSLTSLADANILKLKYAHPIDTIANTKETNIMAAIGSIKKKESNKHACFMLERAGFVSCTTTSALSVLT